MKTTKLKTIPLEPMNAEEEARFLDKVLIREDNSCWDWCAATDKDGYGTVRHRGKMVRAHRLSYRTFVGDIPEDAVLDHVGCDRPECVSPYHLKTTTQAGNLLREGSKALAAANARKEQCPRGHDLTGGNLRRDSLKNGQRSCRTCNHAHDMTRNHPISLEEALPEFEALRLWEFDHWLPMKEVRALRAAEEKSNAKK